MGKIERIISIVVGVLGVILLGINSYALFLLEGNWLNWIAEGLLCISLLLMGVRIIDEKVK